MSKSYTESQKILNTNILLLSQELGIKLIMGCDSHYINDETSWERTDYLASKGIAQTIIIFLETTEWHYKLPINKQLELPLKFF